MIIKPKIDNREYKYLLLPNDLQVLIVNDETTNMTSASLTVKVGYYNDPVDTPGLAHFLEHMIFMGSKKYPNVSEFMDYLNKYGGTTNAYTSFNITNYFFNITTSKFKNAFDIFYNLFLNPLFKSETINKEINAVNSEHEKNKFDDSWRVMEVLKHASNNNYPFHKFGTGSKKTLNKPNIREQLLDLYKLYSSNIMRLVIYTNLPIHKIEKLVKNTFSNIKNNNNNKLITTTELPFEPKYITMNSINDSDILNMYFYTPSFINLFKFKIKELILFLLNHEGLNTLNYILEKKNFCYSFSVSDLSDDEKFCIIHCEFNLTKYGLDNINTIYSLFDQYIKLMLSDNLERYFKEQQINNQTIFNYIEKYDSINYITDLQENFIFYPTKYLIYGPYYYKTYDQSQVKNVLSYLNIQNALIILNTKNITHTHTHIEPHYKIKYNAIPSNIKLVDPIYILELPIRNKYVIDDNMLQQKISVNTSPTKIIHEDNIEVWHASHTFDIPKTSINIIFINTFYDNIRTYMLTELYINLITYKYQSTLYYADISDNTIAFGIRPEYYYINIEAYNSVIYDMLDDINIKDQTFDLNSFEYIKGNLMNSYKNYIYKALTKLSMIYACDRLYPKYYNFKDQLRCIKAISYEDFINSLVFLNNNKIKILITGQLDKDKIIEYTNRFKHNIHITMVDLTIPKNGTMTYTYKNLNENDNNSAILMLYQLDYINKSNKKWYNTVILMNIIVNMISSDFFNELRSAKQLGYLVKCAHIKLGSIQNPLTFISFFVQSPTYDANHLEKEIRTFISNVKIKNIEKYKTNFYNKLNEPFNNMTSYNYYLLNEIINDCYCFNYKKKLQKHIQHVTKSSVLEFYDKYILNCHPKVIKILGKS